MTTLMWEAVAADVAAVLAWAAAYDADGLAAKEVYVSDEDARVVVVTHWTGDAPDTLPAPAAALARAGHAWRFRRVS